MSSTRSTYPPARAASAPGRPAPKTPARRDAGIVLSVVALVLVIGTLFFFQVRHFAPFITDDSFISLRYSQRLLHGKGLTWNDLRPVEGYTNLLWVLCCAALGALGLKLPFAAQALGIVCTGLALAAVAAQALRDFPAKVRFIAALIGCGAMVLSGPVDVWAQGGLEQPMLAALLAWAAYFGMRWVSVARPPSRETTIIGLLLGFACLTRADAPLFAGAFWLGAVLADGVRVRTALNRAPVLLFPVLFSLAQLLFRRLYYGEWLPNTAYVKVAFTLHRVRTGLKYDLIGFRTEFFFFVLVVIGAVALLVSGKSKQVKFIATPVLAWLAYIVLIGGDIFPSIRHFIPAISLGAFLVSGCGLLTLGAPFRFSKPRLALLLILTALVLTSDHYCQPETWEAQGKSIGLFLKQAFGAERPLLSSDAAGVVPFYSELPALDPLGLNDYHISRHRTKDRGQGWVGHELADGKYVLDHKPDLLIFSNYESDIYFPADKEIAADPRFGTYYQKMQFDTDPPHATRAMLYIRRLDGPLALKRSADRIVIPGYLATASEANSVRLVDGGAQLVIPAGSTALFAAIPTDGGTWTPHAESTDSGALKISATSGGSAQSSYTVTNTSSRPVTLAELVLARDR